MSMAGGRRPAPRHQRRQLTAPAADSVAAGGRSEHRRRRSAGPHPEEAAPFEWCLRRRIRDCARPRTRQRRHGHAIENPRSVSWRTHADDHRFARRRGRRLGRVFAPAADGAWPVEIDGDPSRQDLDYILAREALEAGCLFALDSDAHTTQQLGYVETALAHAKLAGIPSDRIVNCWPLDRLLAWLSNPIGFSDISGKKSPIIATHPPRKQL